MKRYFAGAVSAAALLLVGANASAATYDAGTEFSSTQGGTSGVWTYGEFANGQFSLLTYNAASNSYLGTDQFGTPLIGAPDGSTLAAHPGQFGESVDLRFTAPTAGSYTATYTGVLTDNSCGSCVGTDGVTGSVGTGSFVIIHSPGSNSGSTSSTVTLTAGGTLDFLLSPNANFNYDSTRITADVTSLAAVSAAPEPGAWALMLGGVGFMGLALRSRRRQPKLARATAA